MGVYTWVKIGCKYPLQTGQYWVQINTPWPVASNGNRSGVLLGS